MSELKKEFKNYLEDLEKNIQNKQDLEYIKGKTAEFMNFVLDQMEKILDYKEDKIMQIEKIQNDIEQKIALMQRDIEEIEEDIYIGNPDLMYEDDEDDDFEFDDQFEDEFVEVFEKPSEYDFEIVCPYCDNEFLIDLSQEKSEIECPRCNNIIELDWTGDTEEQETKKDGCTNGHCSNCPGCEPDDEDNEEDM